MAKEVNKFWHFKLLYAYVYCNPCNLSSWYVVL